MTSSDMRGRPSGKLLRSYRMGEREKQFDLRYTSRAMAIAALSYAQDDYAAHVAALNTIADPHRRVRMRVLAALDEDEASELHGDEPRSRIELDITDTRGMTNAGMRNALAPFERAGWAVEWWMSHTRSFLRIVLESRAADT
jgi:hypothetical protein